MHLESEFVPARGAVVSHGDVWEFSAETREHIPLIYLLHNPGRFQQLLYSAGSEQQGEAPVGCCADSELHWGISPACSYCSDEAGVRLGTLGCV